MEQKVEPIGLPMGNRDCNVEPGEGRHEAGEPHDGHRIRVQDSEDGLESGFYNSGHGQL